MSCPNLRVDENGQIEDPISLQPIPPRRIATFETNGRNYCYDTLSLLRWWNEQDRNGVRPNTFPDTQYPAALDDYHYIREIIRQLYPQYYVMFSDNSQDPEIEFNSLRDALIFLYRNIDRDLQLYRAVRIDDPEIHDIFYDSGYIDTGDQYSDFIVSSRDLRINSPTKRKGWFF